MKHTENNQISHILQNVREGTLLMKRCRSEEAGSILLTEQFHAITSGKGRIEAYSLFPGAEASFNTFLAPDIKFCHDASESVLEIYYCHSGRVGWNMRGGTSIYLGAGDLTVHSTACCADSAMILPLGYLEGISISVDLERLHIDCPEVLQEADVRAKLLQERFCTGNPAAIPTCPELEHIFAPLYTSPTALRQPLLKLKIQELLLYLNSMKPDHKELTQYFSQQTELIKEIHQLLTTHLDQRFTIEELSKRYLINTSTLKEVFKAVYGLPIATYMKEYRIRQSMKLLRETNSSIADIATQVGYETQGKFSKAFKDVTQVLPTEYRKMQRGK